MQFIEQTAESSNFVCGKDHRFRGHRTIKVCYLIDNLAVAGTERHLLSLIDGLDHDNFAPYLCLLDGDNAESRRIEPTSCPVIRLGVKSFRSLHAIQAARQFVRLLRGEHIDILQLFLPSSTYFGTFAGRIAHVSGIVHTRRNTGYWMTNADRRVSRFVKQFASATIANSQACKDSVVEQEGASPDRVIVIPNAVDLAAYRHLEPFRPPEIACKLRIGIVANLRPVKNVELLIRAVDKLRSRHPLLRLEIVGEGECRRELEQLIGELRLQDTVRLLGSLADIPSFLEGLHVAVLCSNSEGLSNSLIEYMAAGRPIVATDVGGNAQLISNGKTGLLVPPQDVHALTSAIGRLLLDPTFAARLAAAARRHAEREYSMSTAVHQHEELYRQLAFSNRS